VLIILQGVPGSGKSTLARMIANSNSMGVICSTDDFFMVSGVYQFDKTKLAEYHARNQEEARQLLKRGYIVVVDNCNIKRIHARPYVAMAIAMDLPVLFIRCEGRYGNLHGVPEHIVERMKNEMETLTIDGCLAAMEPAPSQQNG
jgi:predicted kinase